MGVTVFVSMVIASPAHADIMCPSAGTPSPHNQGWCYTGQVSGGGCVVEGCIETFGVVDKIPTRVDDGGGTNETILIEKQVGQGEDKDSSVDVQVILQNQTSSKAQTAIGRFIDSFFVMMRDFYKNLFGGSSTKDTYVYAYSDSGKEMRLAVDADKNPIGEWEYVYIDEMVPMSDRAAHPCPIDCGLTNAYTNLKLLPVHLEELPTPDAAYVETETRTVDGICQKRMHAWGLPEGDLLPDEYNVDIGRPGHFVTEWGPCSGFVSGGDEGFPDLGLPTDSEVKDNSPSCEGYIECNEWGAVLGNSEGGLVKNLYCEIDFSLSDTEQKAQIRECATKSDLSSAEKEAVINSVSQ